MKVIRQLDKHLVNKIAAGEVVERPLSVVKELTENAIDAGASTLTVEIKEGGLSVIRVTDNGSGIPADQVDLAFAQHATSKIADIEDLERIGTLGFRGEALASIASVSLVEMITKTAGAIAGTRLELHGGTVVARQELGCSEGTTINVSNLFFNTPARLKFLKRPATEAGYVTDLMQRLALGYPGLAFRYISNGQVMLSTNGNGDLKTAIYNIYGRDVARGILEVKGDGFISGYIGKPEIARGSRGAENFFINGRYIKSNLLQDVLEEVYRSRLPAGRFPLCVLHLQVPPEQVDVNVHPAKMEVRFADEREVYSRVSEALNKAISDIELIPSIRARPVLPAARPNRRDDSPRWTGREDESVIQEELDVWMPDGLGEIGAVDGVDGIEEIEAKGRIQGRIQEEIQGRVQERSQGWAQEGIQGRTPEEIQEIRIDETGDVETFKKPEYFSSLSLAEEASTSMPAPSSAAGPASAPASGSVSVVSALASPDQKVYGFTIIGQVFNTYWLVAREDDLFLIDQHAAHERILYEEMLSRLKNQESPAQPLLEPVTVPLNPRELATALEYKKVLEDFSFEFEVRECNVLRLLAVPMILNGPVDSAFFIQLLDKLEMGNENSPSAQIREELAMAACKTSVKGADALSVAEAKELIKRMHALENPYTCPHGRPTIIKLTRREIERMFKRI